MSARTRPPSDEIRTEIYDSAHGKVDHEASERTGPPQRARAGSPTRQGYERGGGTSRPPRTAFPAAQNSVPKRLEVAQTDRSEPIKVFSLKTPDALKSPRPEDKPRRMPRPQIRSIGEVSGTHTPPRGMGYLAPPRDLDEAHKRHARSNLRWAAVTLIVAVAVGIGIWITARR
jgi:hypothetical protein